MLMKAEHLLLTGLLPQNLLCTIMGSPAADLPTPSPHCNATSHSSTVGAGPLQQMNDKTSREHDSMATHIVGAETDMIIQEYVAAEPFMHLAFATRRSKKYYLTQVEDNIITKDAVVQRLKSLTYQAMFDAIPTLPAPERATANI